MTMKSGGWVLMLLATLLPNDYVDAAQAKGNPHVEIVVKLGRTSKLRPLRAVDNVTLWCQVGVVVFICTIRLEMFSVLKQEKFKNYVGIYRKSWKSQRIETFNRIRMNPECCVKLVFHKFVKAEEHGSALTIKSAMFVRKKDGVVLTATISEDGKRASHNFGTARVDEAGNYTCKITTANGSVSGNHQVFVRPVLMVGESDRFDAAEDDAFRFEGNSISSVMGHNVNLTCPVVAFPAARHSWTKDGKILVADGEHVRFAPGGVVELIKVRDEDRGIYECTAKNEFIINGRTQVSSVVLSRRLRVKGELAWLWPLLVIIAIVALLILIIVFCECRKKRNEQKL
ncbi:unnamed protein product [Toxocara canis]|uniref:Ig-like domain-containing protein n=2 Tax=Toxocara canis TaxID=6265 RepID=A0A183UZY3_TOXCA|nr:unnamed protein product [Toxocara canis]